MHIHTSSCFFCVDLQSNLKSMYESNWALKKRNGHLERENRELKKKLQQGGSGLHIAQTCHVHLLSLSISLCSTNSYMKELGEILSALVQVSMHGKLVGILFVVSHGSVVFVGCICLIFTSRPTIVFAFPKLFNFVYF